MAGFITKSFLFTLSMMIMMNIIFQQNNGCNAFDFDSIKKSISSGINSVVSDIQDATCLIQYREEFDRCQNAVKFWKDNPYEPNGQKKAYCCDFIAYKQCLTTVARLRCGSAAQETVDSIMSTLKKGFYPSYCDAYDNIFDCMDPLLFWSLGMFHIS
ncbi:hypothetical protein DERP_005941 [Dermatophagoides pteronyssinus]|uniref:Uncharacterized protein n=1 Tax=Dermatophagoides pteronyssinus TaxID=6956 RepID=A0ABQ8JSR1_DERPT|nr:hypothetical protein DERP_005941 [Dermatophagoides pteronyssinus]